MKEKIQGEKLTKTSKNELFPSVFCHFQGKNKFIQYISLNVIF